MNKYFKLITIIVLALVTTYALPQEHKQINVQPGQKLNVDIECGANIIVEGWDKNIVDINVDISGRDADDINIDISETSYGVLVTADYDHHRKSRSTDGDVTVKVPKKFNLELKTMGGTLNVIGVEGDLEGTTMGGSLALKNLMGDIDFTTMGGSIELSDSEVDGEVSTMGGNISLENIIGDVDASTMGGNVTQKNVKSSSGSTGKEVKTESMGGSINVDEAMYGADVSTMGGNVMVKKAAEFVKASTMGGNVTIDEIAGWVDASTMGGDVKVKVVGAEGDRQVELSSMGGDIWLYVPADLSMDIEIEILFEEDEKDEIGVESDFDLVERIEDRDDGNWEQDTKKLIATGSTGSAKNKIRISTVDGMVYLKKN